MEIRWYIEENLVRAGLVANQYRVIERLMGDRGSPQTAVEILFFFRSAAPSPIRWRA